MIFEQPPRYFLILAAAVLLAVLVIKPSAATTVLKLDDATPPEGRVLFRPGICEILPTPSISNPNQMIEAQTEHYDLYLDADHVVFANFGYFVYAFYVRPKSEALDHKQ